MFNFSNPPMISPSKAFRPAPLGMPHSEAAAAMQGSGVGMINYPPMSAAGEHALMQLYTSYALQHSNRYATVCDLFCECMRRHDVHLSSQYIFPPFPLSMPSPQFPGAFLFPPSIPTGQLIAPISLPGVCVYVCVCVCV